MKSLSLIAVTFLFATAVYAKEVTTQIKVSGMTCDACSISVQKSLEKVKGVKRAQVSSDKGLATVTYEDTQATEQQLRDAINRTGFKAEPNQEKK